ncbi:MAG TPA: lysophospholipid acyltransferase family protein [Candidatus Limnocylindria bacterium]|nr:lysophospholipid acyltransferase family protein [Candidatus Limnocylindria bacterium]
MITDQTPEWPVERLFLWRLLYPPVRTIVMALVRVRVEGREHLPASGPYIIASNHIDWKDPPLITITLDRSVRYMAKIQAFSYPLLGYILRATGAFPVRRGEGDRRALVTALRVLRGGQILGFFPEGHRSESGALLRGKPGIGFLASRVPEVPFVPVAMIGTKQPLLRLIFGGHAILRVGRPFRLAELSADERRDEQAITDAIMRRIAALLPAEMRGAYP